MVKTENGELELLFAHEVATRLRMTTRQIMTAYRRGQLRSYVVDANGTPRFVMAVVLEDFERYRRAAE